MSLNFGFRLLVVFASVFISYVGKITMSDFLKIYLINMSKVNFKLYFLHKNCVF